MFYFLQVACSLISLNHLYPSLQCTFAMASFQQPNAMSLFIPIQSFINLWPRYLLFLGESKYSIASFAAHCKVFNTFKVKAIVCGGQFFNCLTVSTLCILHWFTHIIKSLWKPDYRTNCQFAVPTKLCKCTNV